MTAKNEERTKRGKPESCGIMEYVKDETSKPNQPEPSGGDGKAVAYGLIAGVMTSIIFGFIMDDKALGLAIGAGVGITLGAAFSAKKRFK